MLLATVTFILKQSLIFTLGILSLDSRDVRVCCSYDMGDKVRGLTIEYEHGRKTQGSVMLPHAKEAEILKLELFSFRRLCISWGQNWLSLLFTEEQI